MNLSYLQGIEHICDRELDQSLENEKMMEDLLNKKKSPYNLAGQPVRMQQWMGKFAESLKGGKEETDVTNQQKENYFSRELQGQKL